MLAASTEHDSGDQECRVLCIGVDVMQNDRDKTRSVHVGHRGADLASASDISHDQIQSTENDLHRNRKGAFLRDSKSNHRLRHADLIPHSPAASVASYQDTSCHIPYDLRKTISARTLVRSAPRHCPHTNIRFGLCRAFPGGSAPTSASRCPLKAYRHAAIDIPMIDLDISCGSSFAGRSIAFGWLRLRPSPPAAGSSSHHSDLSR